jgi:hypothetical protein
MGKIIYPNPVKLIFSIISAEENYFLEAKKCLANIFGKIDLESNYQTFGFTDYYRNEMGEHLKQKLLSFKKLILPVRLSQIKIDSNQLEFTLSVDNHQENTAKGIKRKLNLDPGYLTLGKFILASTKNGPARIYLKQGIYAEITLGFINKSFHSLEWTYQNYQTDLYINFLNQVRKEYKEQLRTGNRLIPESGNDY